MKIELEYASAELYQRMYAGLIDLLMEVHTTKGSLYENMLLTRVTEDSHMVFHPEQGNDLIIHIDNINKIIIY